MQRSHHFHGQMSDTFRAAVFVTLSGGFQDAYTYISRGQVFANAQTGNIVLLSAALLRGDWAVCLKYLIPILSFVLGTMAAEFIHIRFRNFRAAALAAAGAIAGDRVFVRRRLPAAHARPAGKRTCLVRMCHAGAYLP